MRMRRTLRAGNWASRMWRVGPRRDLVGSLLAGVVSQGVLVVSGVVVARALGPEDRGYLALVLLVPWLLALIANLGLPLASTYFVARSPQSARSIAAKLVVPAALQSAVGVLLTLGVLLTVLSREPARVTSAGLVATALAPAIVVQTYGLGLLQGQRRFRAFNSLRVAPPFLSSIGVLGAYLAGLDNLVELTAATVAANLVAAGLIVAVLLRGLGPRGDTAPAEEPSLSEMTRFGVKGFFGSVSAVESFRLDQAAVALLLSPVALGYYVVAQAFMNLPRFLAQSVGMIAYPSVAASREPRAARRSLWRHFALGAALALGTVMILELAVSSLLPLFFGAAFSEAVPSARILLIGAFFVSARRVLADGVRGAGHPALGTMAEAVSWVIMLPAMIVLTPMFGLEGVALAVTGAWAASLAVLLAATALVVHGQGQRLKPALVSLATRHPHPGRRRAGVVLPVLSISLIAAAAAVLLPPYASLGIAGLLGVLVVAALVRREFSHRLPRTDPTGGGAKITRHDVSAAASRDDHDDFRLARFFYYTGFAMLGQLTLRPAPVGTLSDVVFIASFASAASLLAMYKRRVALSLPPLLLYGLLIFSIGALASTFSSLSWNASVAVVLRLVLLTAVWFWLGTVVLRQLKHILTAAALWVASAALNGVGALAQLSIDPNIIPGGYNHWGRVTGFTEHVNDLGGIAAVVLIPALMFCMRRSRKPVFTVASYAGLLLTATGLILSGSIGALLAATVGAALWITATPRIPARTFVFFCVALIGAVSLLQIQESNDAPSPAERFERVSASPTDPNATLWSRVDTYRVATERILDNPFTGVGLDSASSTIGQWEPHNLVIGVWFKAGFLGLAGVILVLGAVFSAARATLRNAASVDEQMVALALLCAFVAFLVFSMSAPILYTRYGWAPAALLLGLRAIQIRRAAPRALDVQAPRRELAPARVHSIAAPP